MGASLDLRVGGVVSGEASRVASRQQPLAPRNLALVKRLAVMLAALALGLAIPPLAVAQFGPTNVPAPLTQTDDSDQAVTSDDSTGLTTLQLVLIFGAAVGIIGLIGYLIMRDAHRAAPAAAKASAKAAAAAGGTPKKNKSAREREREQARKRAKAKAARDQRKRNRPR
jgi:branched-subunit amino acid ABC-type transport system permease component